MKVNVEEMLAISHAVKRPVDCVLTQAQVQNCLVAYLFMFRAPAHQVNLDYWRHNKVNGDNLVSDDQLITGGCGTTACIAGWLTTVPHFQKQELTYRRGAVLWQNRDDATNRASQELFGSRSMFTGIDGEHTSDGGLPDKREALARLRMQLFSNGCIDKHQCEDWFERELALEN